MLLQTRFHVCTPFLRREETFVKPPQSSASSIIVLVHLWYKQEKAILDYTASGNLTTLKYSILRLQADYASAIKSLRLSQVNNVAYRGKIVPNKHRLRRLTTTSKRAHLERTITYFFSHVNTKNYNTIVFESWSFRAIYVRILASELKRKCSNQAVANGISIFAIKLKATRTLRMFSVHQDQIQEHFTSVSKSRQTNRCNISEQKLQGLEIRVVTATIIG